MPGFDPYQLSTIADQMRERHLAAVEAARELADTSVTPCPVEVEPSCRRTEQDNFEKQNSIAPGCGYYRRRYNNFIERQPDLTPPTYYLEYGEKYCNKFTDETFHNLSSEGQKWLTEVKCGLQENIEKLLQNPDKRYLEYLEKDFADATFATHAPVYLENGLADITLGDQFTIGSTPLKEFFWGDHKAATWKQAGEVLPDVVDGWKRNYLGI